MEVWVEGGTPCWSKNLSENPRQFEKTKLSLKKKVRAGKRIQKWKNGAGF